MTIRASDLGVSSGIHVYFNKSIHYKHVKFHKAMRRNYQNSLYINESYDCSLYDAKNMMLLASAKSNTPFMTISLENETRVEVSKIEITCRALINGRNFRASTNISLKKPYTQYTHPLKKAQASITKETLKIDIIRTLSKKIDDKNAYKDTPNIFIGDTHIYDLKDIIYRNKEKTHLLFKASSGQYVIPIKDLKKAEFFNFSDHIYKKFERLFGFSIVNDFL